MSHLSVVFDKGILYRFLYAMRHNDANNMTPTASPTIASLPDFRQNR